MPDWIPALFVLAALTGSASPALAVTPAETPAAPDSAPAKVVFWPEVTTLIDSGRVRDVGFTDPDLNIVNAVEMAWCAEASTGSLIAVATKPIAGTADAGEEIGRRAERATGNATALCVATAGMYVLGDDARLLVLRSGWTDTLALGPAGGPAHDIAVSTSGLVHVLLGDEVRIFADPPRGAPLWKFALPRKLGSAVALDVSARGEVYVAGTRGIGVFELGEAGTWEMVRSRTTKAMGIQSVGGVALTPALLVPLAEREGWARRDRFLLVSDTGKPGILALEASTLEPLDRIDFGQVLPGVVPGRLDVSNRSQIAFADPVSGRALALPARLFERVIGGAEIRWRDLRPDSTAAGSPGP